MPADASPAGQGPGRAVDEMDTVRMHRRRVATVGAVASALVVGVPLAPEATAAPGGVRSPSAAVGSMYGGVTPEGNPVVLEVTADRRRVLRAVTVLRLTCTSGDTGLVTDEYPTFRVSRKGRFTFAFGPDTVRNDDGTTTDFQGRLAGRFNDARTRISGTWSYTITHHDASGAVTDSCTSGTVAWKARQ